MPQTILLRGAKQLVTLRGPSGVRRGAALHDLGIIDDGSVLIRDGIIVSVGSTRRIENLKEARHALEIPADGHVVMPGLIDGSLSLALNQPGARGNRRRSAGFQDETLALLRSCLAHGTLAADIKATANAPELRADVAMLRKLARIGSNPVRMSRTWKVGSMLENRQMQIQDLRETFAVLARRRLMHSIEFTAGAAELVPELMLEIAMQTGIGCKLLWPGGDSEMLSALLARLNPRAVYSVPGLTDSEACVFSQFGLFRRKRSIRRRK